MSIIDPSLTIDDHDSEASVPQEEEEEEVASMRQTEENLTTNLSSRRKKDSQPESESTNHRQSLTQDDDNITGGALEAEASLSWRGKLIIRYLGSLDPEYAQTQKPTKRQIQDPSSIVEDTGPIHYSKSTHEHPHPYPASSSLPTNSSTSSNTSKHLHHQHQKSTSSVSSQGNTMTQQHTNIPWIPEGNIKIDVYLYPPPTLSIPKKKSGNKMATNKAKKNNHNFIHMTMIRQYDESVTKCLNRLGLNIAKKVGQWNKKQNNHRHKDDRSEPNYAYRQAFFKKKRQENFHGGKDGNGASKHKAENNGMMATSCQAFIGTDQEPVDAGTMTNYQFWSRGLEQPISLQMTAPNQHNKVNKHLNLKLEVEINPPTITAVSSFEEFEAYIFPDIPIHIQIQTMFATSALVDWYANGELVCRDSPVYVPTSHDANKELSILITPMRSKNRPHAGEGCQEAFQFLQKVSPTRPVNITLDQVRPQWQQLRRDRALRVLSYNILADQNAFSGPNRECFFPWCPEEVVERKRRMPLIVHELLAYQADLICLQEVDQLVFDTLLEPVLKHYHYQGFYSVKQTTGNQEGCAMFWSLRRFKKVTRSEDCSTYRISDLLSQLQSSQPTKNSDNVSATSNESDGETNPAWAPCVKVLIEIFEKRPDLLKLIQNKLGHVVQMVHLCGWDGSPLLVSNTHLFYHPKAPHIRLMQLFAIAHKLSIEQQRQPSMQVSPFQSMKGKGVNAQVTKPFIFCGDLNSSLKNCALLLLSRHIPSNYRDYRQCYNSFRWEERNAFGQDDVNSEGPTVGQEQSTKDHLVVHDDDFPEIRLPNSFPKMESAYPTLPNFTHFVVGFSAVLDHILMTPQSDLGNLRFLRQAEMPSFEQVSQDTALPSPYFPSDHIAVISDLEWTSKRRHRQHTYSI